MQTRNVFLSLRDPRPDYAAIRATKLRAKARAKFRRDLATFARESALLCLFLALAVPVAFFLHAISTYYYG